MTVPGLIVLFLFLVSIGALAVFSLALANVLAGWGIFFFYTVPALAMLGWAWHESSPSTWRRAIWPFLRARRTLMRASRRGGREAQSRSHDALRPPARLPQPAGHPPDHLVLAAPPVAVIVEGTIQPWLVVMRAFLTAWRSRRGRMIVTAGFGLAAAGTFALVGKHFATIGWPLDRSNLGLVAVAASLFLCGYAFKAFGWRRLFRPHERPGSLTLAAASGAAAVTGAALPGRFDDVVRIAVIRRLTGPHPRIGTVVLTLFLVGLLDATALAPFAAGAAATAKGTLWEQVALAVVAGAGASAALLIAALPRITLSRRVGRYRLGRWLSEHAPASPRDAWHGTVLVTVSWLTRAVGVYVLLAALGFGHSFPLAIAYLAAGAASAALPIGPAGAATQAGAGAAILTAAGIGTEKAVAFAVVAQSLSILAGLAVVLATLARCALRRLQARRTPTPAILAERDSTAR
jgi:hypothetical protein